MNNLITQQISSTFKTIITSLTKETTTFSPANYNDDLYYISCKASLLDNMPLGTTLTLVS